MTQAPSPSGGKYMGKKPMRGVTSGRQAGGGAAYFFLRDFAFFSTISACVLGGIESIRRASSSSDIGGRSGFGLVMVGV